MKRLGVIALLPLVLWCQPVFFGYFESETDILQISGSNYNFGYNKFRLDGEARPNDHVLIGANINVQRYWGKTTWNIYDFIPGFANTGAMLNIELPDTILLDNVYMKLSFPKLDLTVGRQQISPGVGYAWNPTDIFNSKSLMDPSYEQTGVPAIRLDIPLGLRSTISTVYKPEADWDHSSKQVWLNAGLGRFDFSITVAEYKWQTQRSIAYDYGLQDTRSLVGGSLVGELFGWGIWSEYGYNEIEYLGLPSPLVDCFVNLRPESPFWEMIIGMDHTFDNSLYLLGEYLHNEYSQAEMDELIIFDYLLNLNGDTHSLMQDYGFLYLMYPTFDFVSLSLIAIANFNDRSAVIGPQVNWNVFEDTNISLQGSFGLGDADTEFGLQDWGLRLRVTSNF